MEVNVHFCFWQKEKKSFFKYKNREPTLIQDGKLCLKMVLDSFFFENGWFGVSEMKIPDAGGNLGRQKKIFQHK